MSNKNQSDDSEVLRPDPEAYVHQIHEKRHLNDADVKVVITQRNSNTGGGKTTLAVWLALCWDQHGWGGEEKGTTDPNEFLRTMPDLPPHSVMILDEAEELDSRRSMSEQNVEFSKYWMKMRTRMVDSILTLPTTSALDKRLLELAHVRLHVTKRGEAKVYKIDTSDRHGEVNQQFIEHYYWPDVSDSDEFQQLDEQKQADLDAVGDETAADDERDEEGLKQAIREEAKRRRREGESIREIIGNIPENPDTGNEWSTRTIQRWTKDVEKAG